MPTLIHPTANGVKTAGKKEKSYMSGSEQRPGMRWSLRPPLVCFALLVVAGCTATVYKPGSGPKAGTGNNDPGQGGSSDSGTGGSGPSSGSGSSMGSPGTGGVPA